MFDVNMYCNRSIFSSVLQAHSSLYFINRQFHNLAIVSSTYIEILKSKDSKMMGIKLCKQITKPTTSKRQ